MLTLVCLRHQKRGWKTLFGIILFGLYIIAAVGMIFFPISIPLDWPSNLTWNETLLTLRSINLSPLYFMSITRHPFTLLWLFVDFGLNLILTIPFGFGLGILYKPKFLKILFWALLTGLTTEGIQLLVKLTLGTFYHTVDINDVILNTLGVIVGYVLFLIQQNLRAKFKNNKATQLV